MSLWLKLTFDQIFEQVIVMFEWLLHDSVRKLVTYYVKQRGKQETENLKELTSRRLGLKGSKSFSEGPKQKIKPLKST